MCDTFMRLDLVSSAVFRIDRLFCKDPKLEFLYMTCYWCAWSIFCGVFSSCAFVDSGV